MLFEVETGKLVQLGTKCVKDFIPGANSPERVAAWAEWLYALDEDLEFEGSDGFGGSEGGGRLAIRTQLFLENVAAVMRDSGWQPRWFKDGYGGFERNNGATADRATNNMLARKPEVKVTEADIAEASRALEWVREDLAERDELDEFEHNLVTYTKADYLGEKGDGFVAYAMMARRREIEEGPGRPSGPPRPSRSPTGSVSPSSGCAACVST